MLDDDLTDGLVTLSTLGEMRDDEGTQLPYAPLPHSLTETGNISEFTENLVLQDVAAMIGYLEESEGFSREELCDPQLSMTRVTSVTWIALNGTKKNMTMEIARNFTHVAREILGASDTVTLPLSDNTRPTEIQESRTVIEFRSLGRALETLFPWPKTEEILGITEDPTTRSQMAKPFTLQDSLPKKQRLAGYEARRHKIWEDMSLEAKKMLTTDKPVSVKTLPALLKRGAHQIFWTQCGDLILLWVQAFMWAETGFLSRLDSIKQCILTGNNCLKRSNAEEEGNA